MKSFTVVAALAAGANALAIRDDTCCFTLTASGGTSGTVGQLDDGQNRIGGGLSPTTFCITPGGTITDSSGRGCILTPPTTQLQCDTGATPDSGFSINSSGELTSNGSPDFVACQTGDHGAFNIYTNPPPSDVTGCVHVSLTADQCVPSSSSTKPTTPAASASPISSATPPVGSPGSVTGSPPASPPGSPSGSPSGGPTGGPPVVVVTATETVCAPAPTSPGKPTSPPSQTSGPSPPSGGTPCSTDLVQGGFEFPHLIIPIDSSSPGTAAGTQYNAKITSTISTIFNFDIPASDAGKTCSLVFHFPEQKDLQTSSFTFSGDGKVDFAELSSLATESTTFNNAPSVKTDFGVTTIAPGHSYVISTFACPSGQAIAFELKEAGTTDFSFFEDFNPSPIGLFITTC
ncbi:GPI anchored cell wall protein, putative [Talaromyces stipitatus ATCC 10500]|uniref:GPI anchored cell wall protein, putative n=1 Tax=Talaromyces stipitatus (strain ATCC 10500 / CBS 375.48 / QM 6759 / NRRL 1006) TaxID=441959 RepID=B8M636_TALSN|nr:GPI anchored cell wall protein, putative [Talaromyces stipitatus ATCC 10500]EED19036.1 GPI anchored cell wall protein, putative [Talaromyces stipitatus ATCC 10500]